jgi:hypothetical protein
VVRLRRKSRPSRRGRLAERHPAADRSLSARRKAERRLAEWNLDTGGCFAAWRFAGRNLGLAGASLRGALLSDTLLLADALRGVSLSGTFLLAGASNIR